jgi:hypothetical protein
MSIAPSSRFNYVEDPADVPEDAIGIALSGGGVRAACLGLGALQMAEESGVFGKARYLSAVSGGSYIATAFVAARAQRGLLPASVSPWGRGSGEEAHLRRNLSYLGEDLPDRLLALMYYVTRTVLHQIQFLAGLILVSSTLGAGYRSLGVLVTGGNVLVAEHRPERYLAVLAVLVAGGLLDVSRSMRAPTLATGNGFRARLAKARDRTYKRRVEVRRALVALVAVLVLPDLISAGSHVLNAFDFRRMEDWATAAIALTAFVVVAAFVLRSQKSAAPKFAHRVLLRGGRAVFSLSMIALTVTPLLLLVELQSRWDLATNGILFAISGCILLFFGLFVHANWTSMHHLYAHRLTRAYIVTEPERLGLEAGCGTARHHRRLDQIAFRCVSADHLPELLVCAAVNIGRGESAQGEGCGSFVFSAKHVGGPATEATDLGFLADKPCSDVVAASGAAIAPNMGRLTRHSVRTLLAFLNLRLGLWVSVPRQANAQARIARSRKGTPQPPAAASVPPGCLNRGSDECFMQDKCERLRTAGAGQRSFMHGLRHGWREPGPYWTWKELLGELSAGDKALFISDGGHWDNTGIIELLRRGCRTIFAVDAAVDDFRLSNLVRAVSLARSELGVEIDMTGRMLESERPVLPLTFRYPDDDPSGPKNQLIVMRTFIPEGLPADLVAMSRALGTHGLGSVFPRHVTLNQFLLARDVDGYITLGRWLFEEAVRVADLRPAQTAEPVSRRPGVTT